MSEERTIKDYNLKVNKISKVSLGFTPNLSRDDSAVHGLLNLKHFHLRRLTTNCLKVVACGIYLESGE